jgi:hypothetical protein
VGNKSLPEEGQVVNHRAHLLSLCATLKAKLPHKTEKQTVNHHNILTIEGADRALNRPQRKGVEQRNKP